MEVFMRTVVIMAVTLAALSLSGSSANTQNYVGGSWCANRSDGSTNCGYYSWEQCKANSKGNTNCTSNQWYGERNSRRRER